MTYSAQNHVVSFLDIFFIGLLSKNISYSMIMIGNHRFVIFSICSALEEYRLTLLWNTDSVPSDIFTLGSASENMSYSGSMIENLRLAILSFGSASGKNRLHGHDSAVLFLLT